MTVMSGARLISKSSINKNSEDSLLTVPLAVAFSAVVDVVSDCFSLSELVSK